MNAAGVCSASIRTRDAAGCSRSCSASKSRPAPVGMTISPSITQRGGSSARAAAAISGKYRVIGRSLRLPSSTSSPSRNRIDRNPSHFGSYQASGGISVTDFASIGGTGGITGSLIDSHSDRGGSQPFLPTSASTGSGAPSRSLTTR